MVSQGLTAREGGFHLEAELCVCFGLGQQFIYLGSSVHYESIIYDLFQAKLFEYIFFILPFQTQNEYRVFGIYLICSYFCFNIIIGVVEN